jgi:hypothetical protein
MSIRGCGQYINKPSRIPEYQWAEYRIISISGFNLIPWGADILLADDPIRRYTHLMIINHLSLVIGHSYRVWVCNFPRHGIVAYSA